ncbi:MAG: hypothetical protein AB8G14_13470 [Ilumatobacter sp.]
MSVQAWFSNEDVELDPGSSIALKLSVQNLGEATDSYTIVPSGLTADWVKVDRGNVTLFGGSLDVIDITIAPPRLPSTTAGPTVIGVRIISGSSPDDNVVAETTLDVQSFDDRRIVALQPVIRARRRANYEFMVENHGNGLASCRLRLIDPSKRVDGSFDPPAVGVAPGGASLVRLKARAKRGIFRRAVQTLDFQVEAEQPGHDPSDASLSLVQPSTVALASVAKVIGAAAVIGALVGAWFGVVRPEIRDAAADKVDERLEEFDAAVEQIAAESNTESPITTEPEVEEDTSRPTEDLGEPDFFRLSATPGALSTSDDSFTVPDGQLFDLTDIRIENANNDTGRASLLVNNIETYVWSLANIRGQLFEPSITQIRLEPGDNLTFSVRCDAVGDPALGTCFNAINVGGRTIAIDEI